MEFEIEIVRENIIGDFECELDTVIRNIKNGVLDKEVGRAKLKAWADCLSFYDICTVDQHIDMKIEIENAFYEMEQEN